MTEYTVVWTIDVEAEDAIGAANQAREIMQQSNDPEYMANSFGVADFDSMVIHGENLEWVDLDALEGRV